MASHRSDRGRTVGRVSTWPGCPKAPQPASCSCFHSKTDGHTGTPSEIRDKPTRGLEHQPHKHMSASTSEKVCLAQALP